MASSVAKLSSETIARLQEYAIKEREQYLFLGLDDGRNGKEQLVVISFRTAIAFKTVKAFNAGAKYTPTGSETDDVVSVSCGNGTLGELFECTSLAVLVGGVTVKPFHYAAEAKIHRNALGASWRVREVEAFYPVQPLQNGFRVDYTASDGLTYTYDIPPDRARYQLLLQIP